jgi:serine/threonine-protein kinase
MGTIYRGRDLELERHVAVKLLSPRLSKEAAALARFRLEARSAARLDHPNVVIVYDSGVDQGDNYIVMELVDGGTLEELLRERWLLSAPLALALEHDVLRALAAAHDAGLVHGDVSLDNVMVTRDGVAKVTGFGIAQAFGPDAEAACLAPEQAAGELVTPAADLYGAGCVLYAMLTGQPPVGTDAVVGVAAQRRDEAPAAPSALRAGLPPAVDALVLKALEKRPEDRFASAREMLGALERAGVPLPPPGARDVWRPRGLYGATIAGAAGAGTAAARDARAAAVRDAQVAAAVDAHAGEAPEVPRGQIYPRYIPPARKVTRTLFAGIAALTIAGVVTLLLALAGVLSFQSSASSAGTPRAPLPATSTTTPADAGPSVQTPAGAGPAGTAPAGTDPAATDPASGPTPTAPGTAAPTPTAPETTGPTPTAPATVSPTPTAPGTVAPTPTAPATASPTTEPASPAPAAEDTPGKGSKKDPQPRPEPGTGGKKG